MCRAPDPAASQACLGFAFTPAAQLAAAYQLPNTTVQLVQGYLIWVAQNLVGPTFAADVLGAPLDPASGGLVVKRPLQQWLYGGAQAFDRPDALLLHTVAVCGTDDDGRRRQVL